MVGSEWVLDESKFLTIEEVIQLLRCLAERIRESAGFRKNVAAKDYLLVHLALCTGLRVGEIADLNCGDILTKNGKSSLVVRKGKGGKTRSVQFNHALKNHLVRFLQLKKQIGEPVRDDTPLFYSRTMGRAMTRRALQKAFKRCAAYAGLSPHYSIHSLRHTYACHLYKASGWNLRLVQKHLGHARIITTQVYADVMGPDVRPALEKLYKYRGSVW